MAVDKLVDSTQLDADLTSVANAIRTKGGTSAQLSFPNGFVSAVNAIPTGSDTLLNSATRWSNLFAGAENLPEKIELSPVKLASGDNNADIVNNATGVVELVITLSQTTAFSLYRLFFGVNPIKKLTLTGNLNLCSSYMNMLQRTENMEEINAVFDFTSCVNSNTCKLSTSSVSNSKVTEMRFAANTCSKDLSISSFSALSDTTLASIANCLVSGVTGQTVALHATPKARCSTLMGDNDNGTFVVDVSGAMSLADFITTVKGWTLA